MTAGGGANLRATEPVLILDDEDTVRRFLGQVVEMIGGTPYLAASSTEAKKLVGERTFVCALIDKNLGADNGLEFLSWLRAQQPECDAVIITGYGNLQSAVEALRLGAVDFLQKPFELESLSRRLKLLVERQRMLKERTVLQARLMQSDRLSALGILAAGVVHEINNPLTYVLSNLDYLQEELQALAGQDTAQAAALREFEAIVREIQQGTAQMASVVRNIKTFARHEVVQRQRVDLRAVLNGTITMSTVLIRQRARVTLDFVAAPDVLGFPPQLAQVFLNLLVNASHAIPEGVASENEIRVRLATAPSGEALIEISDTGSGMGPETLARLFEPFFTTKPAGVGTGIGLTICRDIVADHGGRIEVESAIGKGSTFRVLLPSLAPVVVDPVPTTLPAPGTRRGKILIIDDDPDIVTSLQRLLSREHDVSGETAGRAVLARLKGGDRFELIICDLMMPEMTGHQLYGQIRQLDPAQAQRMLFMTAGVLSDVAGTFADQMIDRLLPKPYDIQALRARIRVLLQS